VTSAVRLEEAIPIAEKTHTQVTGTKTSKHAYNPYLAARREWDERYGSLITRERNWRVMAILSSLIALASVGGMIRLSTKSHIVPFVVAMDSLGRTVAAGSAEETSPSDDRLKRATLFNWVEDLRTVTTDGIAQRKAIDRVYAHIASGGQAQAFISEFCVLSARLRKSGPNLARRYGEPVRRRSPAGFTRMKSLSHLM